MLVPVAGVLAVDQVPCTEEVDDVGPAHVAVEVAQLVKAEEALAYVLDRGGQLFHGVRFAFHADRDKTDPLLVVVERTERRIDALVLQVRNFGGGIVEQTHAVELTAIVELHLSEVYIQSDTLVVPHVPLVEADAPDDPPLLHEHLQSSGDVHSSNHAQPAVYDVIQIRRENSDHGVVRVERVDLELIWSDSDAEDERQASVVRQPSSLAREIVDGLLQTVVLLFNLDERHSFILVRSVRSGRGNSGVFVLVSAELTEVGEVLVHVEQGVIPRNSSLFSITDSTVHPSRNGVGNVTVEGVHVHIRVLEANIVVHRHTRGQRSLQEISA